MSRDRYVFRHRYTCTLFKSTRDRHAIKELMKEGTDSFRTQLLNAMILLDDILELLMCAAIIFLELYYLFLGNYVGQEVIDTSVDIFQVT